jgi:adenylate cyclase
MGADEEGTHERLKAHLGQFVDPKIKEQGSDGQEHRRRLAGGVCQCGGRRALRCGAPARDDRPRAGVPEERRIRFRIGVNLGDVIAERDDIFGDGVNVAARLEALAEPGGICISRTVRDQIRDRLPYPFEDRCEQSVKNIARPVRVYALRPEAVADLPVSGVPIAAPRRRSTAIAALAAATLAALVIAVIAWWVWPALKSATSAAMSTSQPLVAPRLSIVVLPFANLSRDPDQQYFADGITEDLTTDLSRFPHLLVISRDTAFTHRNKRSTRNRSAANLAYSTFSKGACSDRKARSGSMRS